MLSRLLNIPSIVLLAAVSLLAASGCLGEQSSGSDGGIVPFTDIARDALGKSARTINRYPGVAIFDYDRDGDLDFYVTQEEGGPNFLFRNDGDESFVEVSESAGVAAVDSNSTGVAACDFDNDGYQDLYVGAHGRKGDGLDFRSASVRPDLPVAIVDRLFLNNGDGTFTDITHAAFGEAANLRSAMSVACADIDGDGWLDIYVANRADFDFVRFTVPQHHGHYNVLYRNNGDLTFSDITVDSGVRGPQIAMRAPDGLPIQFRDPLSGVWLEGYDPRLADRAGNRVGDPVGQTWASLFFDYDDDGDPDLWVADDGDRFKLYRNDSAPDGVKFTDVAPDMGIDRVGQWMGFALGDYDSDLDLDVFVTNIGFHPLTRRPAPIPGADCAYSAQFDWGTCFHLLLRNNSEGASPRENAFADVASLTHVKPSEVMPPVSLDPANIHPAWEAPQGLAAYDFGFGAAFFDFENDGDQDLYWLGALVSRGEGPGGLLYPGAGRFLLNYETGFRDATVEVNLLDIQDVDYSVIDPESSSFDPAAQRIGPEYHENGKGLAKGDLNGDGFVDLIATNSSGDMKADQGIRFVRGPLFVWINGNSENNWLTLRLRGARASGASGSNADGIGARVYVTAKLDGQTPSAQVQDVLGSSSYLSMSSTDLTFGLGSAERVEEIVVNWPSGRVQSIQDVELNKVLVLEEPSN